MKKSLLLLLTFVVVCLLVACDTRPKKDYRKNVKDVEQYIIDEAKASFDFFWNEANTDEESDGYGLISDRYPTNENTIASIASVGFGLTAIPIGIENEWISYEEGYDRAYKTLQTIDQLQKTHGFYYHFINMNSGTREWNSEVSVIDTAILINGVLFSGEYFGGKVKKLADKLYKEVEWDWYLNESTNQFYMGYKPEVGHWGAWSEYAEQLMIYVLAAGSPTYPVTDGPYKAMKYNSKRMGYKDLVEPLIVSHAGTAFTYQFSHAWIDFREIVDEDGTNWYDNSKKAAEAAYLFAQDLSDQYKTVHEDSWGFSASDGPNGYMGNYGSLPSEGGHFVDGTVAPYAAIAFLPFTPENSLKAFSYFETLEPLKGEYGYKDAFNLGTHEGYTDQTIEHVVDEDGWYNKDVIGIDKGIGLLMIENYRSDFVWNVYMDCSYVQDGLERLNFVENK